MSSVVERSSANFGKMPQAKALVTAIDAGLSFDAHQVIFAQEFLVNPDINVVPGEDLIQAALTMVVEFRIQIRIQRKRLQPAVA